jgi:hypothetical protein
MAEDKFVKFNKTMVPENELEKTPRAQSPFIKFQDKNGDGIDDVCVDGPMPIQKCRQCIPNPYSIIGNWRNRNQLNPILNEKSCKYQITYVTPETTTGFLEGMTEDEASIALDALYKKYAYSAVQTLVEYFQKDDSQETINKLLLVTDFTDFHLAPATGSRLKLLYSLDFDDIYELPDIKDDYSDNEVEETDAEDIVIEVMAANMNSDITKLRKTLDLYNRYLKVYRATEGGNLKFKKTGNIFNLGDYGDDGLFGAGILADTYNQLDNWLAGRGYTLGISFYDFFSSDELITKMKMTFTGDYKIKRLAVFTQGCRDRPAAVYKSGRLATLRRQSGWRDKTAVAYFAHQKSMIRDAEARKPKPWIEFLEEYTHPEIFAYKPEGPIGKPSVSDCIANNLENEFKELGQDIFDEVFSIGDAIAKQFHDTLCRSNPDEVQKDLADMGLAPGATFVDLFNMESQAQMQAFFTVDEKDPIFVNMCKRALLNHGFGGMGMADLDKLYRHGLGPMKYCGLFDLLFEAIECLFKGLSLPEALGRIILASLKAMGVEDFGALFIGLPADKRAELDALVRKNLREGKPFQNLNDRSPRAENAPFFGGFEVKRPWENQEYVDHQKSIGRPGPFGGTQASKNPGIVGYDPTQEKRTLAEKLGGPSQSAKDGMDPSVVMDAYILALVEVYEDNYLALLDELSNFPGAQLISAVIALFDCPTPPLFNPSIMDFIKSLSLPFCKGPTDIVSIRMENPFRGWPKLSDILGLIFAILKKVLIMLLMKILLMILAKICEIIGDAICKALETVGAIAGALPDLLSGRESLYSVIRDTICGPTASDQQVEDTVVSLVDQLGVGGAALADRDTAVNFFADSINSMTREEVFESFLTGPPPAALDIMDNLIEFDYPEYRDAFPNKTSLSSFFKNVGVLIPAQTRADMREVLETFPEELMTPANPSMCSTPEELALFDQQRCALLEGRMSPEQCEALNDSARKQLLEDLDDVANTLQMGLPNLIEANMPPVFSDPGCENGMLPYEPEELKEAALLTVEGGVKKIEATFTADMLGEGGFFSKQKDWGFLNMVLSDTYGNPWTVHQEKTNAGAEWVSYYGEPTSDEPLGPPSPPSNPFLLPVWLVGLLAWVVVFPIILFIYLIDLLFFSARRGAYPRWVGGYLHEQFNPIGAGVGTGVSGRVADLPASVFSNELRGGTTFALYGSTSGKIKSMQFSQTNKYRNAKSFSRSFDRLGFDGFLWDTDVELVDTANYGYNVSARVNFGSDSVTFTKRGRKDHADVVLTYRDNGKGYRKGLNDQGAPWGFGFEVRAFYHDLIGQGGIKNRPDDNVRVEVMTGINTNSAFGLGNPSIASGQENEALANLKKDDAVIASQRFEFLSVDDSVDNIDLGTMPLLASSFESQKSFSPPVYALVDMVKQSEQQNGISSGIDGDYAASMYNRVNQQFFEDFATEVYNNDIGWLYGATYPNYTRQDFEYGVTIDEELAKISGNPAEGDWCPWWKLKVAGGQPVWMSDEAFLGISYDAHVNRDNPDKISIFYLEPAKYGGSYNFPPVYAKPPPNTGWTGMVDVMFPEASPPTCKNKAEGIAGFQEVQKMVRDTYASLSEDDRLTGDPDCTRELPFDRILPRTGKSAIRGLIMAGIRCFANVELMKGLGTFTTFAPDFENNYSKIHSGFIVEIMKEACMSTGGNFLNPFNDNEFWYAFLEMGVQYYIDRLDDPQDEYITLDNMPNSIRTALEKIDRLQKSYKYPWDFDDFNSEDYGTFESMKSFRESKNLEAVKRVEDEAKLVLQELVHEQLIAVGKLFIKNAHRGGLSPKYSNMNYYFYNNYCAGGEGLSLHGEHKFRIKRDSLPTEGSNHYSTGDQLALPSGDPYVGEYHTHIDVDGEMIYMAGAYHSADEEHDRLIPFAHELEVVSMKEEIIASPDGNGYSVERSEILLGDIGPTSDNSKEFYLAKFIVINGQKYSNDEGVRLVRERTGFISDNFPGDMKLVKEKIIRDGEVIGEGKPIGVSGNLGVEYMLEFGIQHASSGQKIPMATTKMSAVDVSCGKFIGIEANSKILWCLVNQLQHEPRYRFVTNYIFSVKKSLSLIAIYNSLGLTPSIGEWVTESGTLNSPQLPKSFSDLAGSDTDKPGMHLRDYKWDSDLEKFTFGTTFVPGWLSEDDRNGWFTSFGFLDWDEWDQDVLRKTTRYMKNAFRTHYRNRKWSKPDYGERDPVAEWTNGIVEKFRFNPSYKILPSFQKKQARGNPFDANGVECPKKG